MNPATREKIKTTLIVLISLVVLILAWELAFYLMSLSQNDSDNNDNNAENVDNINNENIIYVSRIIDGDTFELSDNSTIRLLCIDAPEKGKTGYTEAGDFLSGMILDKEVRLEKDKTDRDEYGRLLRYVYVNISGVELFVNQQLVQEGYARVFRYGNDTARCGEIEEES